MQKAIPPRLVEPYLTGRRAVIAGFVYRVQDSSFASPAEYYEALDLGYDGSGFGPDLAEVYVLRWNAVGPESYRVPYSAERGGDWSGKPPFTGTGYTSSRSACGRRVLPRSGAGSGGSRDLPDHRRRVGLHRPVRRAGVAAPGGGDLSMRYRLMATYRGVPYEAGIGPTDSDVVLFAACPPPEELGFEPATGHWRKQLRIEEVQALWESRPMGTFRGDRCIVLDDLGDRLHIAYLGHDAYQAEQLGYWQVDRGVFELITPRDEVSEIVEERLDYPHPGARRAPRGPPTAECRRPRSPEPPPGRARPMPRVLPHRAAVAAASPRDHLTGPHAAAVAEIHLTGPHPPDQRHRAASGKPQAAEPQHRAAAVRPPASPCRSSRPPCTPPCPGRRLRCRLEAAARVAAARPGSCSAAGPPAPEPGR